MGFLYFIAEASQIMGIETWKKFPTVLEDYHQNGIPLPCSDQHPRLKCKETRWARDFCIAQGGACEYKIEAHFDCLEQFYPKAKVDILRKSLKPGAMDYPTSDSYIRYRHYYVSDAYVPSKQALEGLF
eukprot:GDKK01059126.1.p1 GENE.GDKK01059126.1~~GDKK01059126.1.p1  ORF type:complete len:128 (+),score=9.69 GDKK01059126.1:1-384(+)